jgi:hypothetical protein
VQQWVRQSRGSGRNLDLHEQLQSGRSVNAAHSLNRQKKSTNLFKKSMHFSNSHNGKVNVGLASVNHVTAGLGHGRIYVYATQATA